VSGFTGWTVERWSLAVAALVTVAAAVSMDVIADEHPTHTLTLGLIAVVVAALRIKLDGRYQGLFSTVSGALALQPALHATSELGSRPLADWDNESGPLHVVLADGPTTAVQIIVTALVVVAVASCARIVEFLFGTVYLPLQLLLVGTPEVVDAPVESGIRSQHFASILQSCGWAILASRRGPPDFCEA
jgi:hypothetical protein